MRSEQITAAAEHLVAYYRSVSKTAEMSSFGRPEYLLEVTRDLLQSISNQVGVLLTRPVFDVLVYATERSLDVHFSTLNRRRVQRYIKPRFPATSIKDVLECSPSSIYHQPESDTIDVAGDIARYSVELDMEYGPTICRIFEDRCIKASRDQDIPLLISFYKSLHALQLGEHLGRRALANSIDDATRRALVDKGRAYYRKALEYAVTGMNAIAVVLMGPRNSGKTTLSEALAYSLGWTLYDATSADQAVAHLATGISCIVDMDLSTIGARGRFREMIKRAAHAATSTTISKNYRLLEIEYDCHDGDPFIRPLADEDEHHTIIARSRTIDATVATILKRLVQMA